MRTFSNAVKALLAGAALKVSVVARLSLPSPSGTQYVSDGNTEFVWNGQTYIGLGEALAIEAPPSTITGPQPQGAIRLSGVDPLIAPLAALENYRAQPVEAALLLFDPATGLPVEEVLVLKGRMDTLTRTDSQARWDAPKEAQTTSMTMSVTPQTADLARAGSRSRSDADQKAHRDPLDGFYKDVGMFAHTTFWWGKYDPNSTIGQLAGSGFLGNLAATVLAKIH